MSCASDEKNIKEIIQETINSSHNKNLVNVDMAPNTNLIYHLYQDGEITSQKGSWAYGRRSEFTLHYPIHVYKNNFTFPLIREKFGYVIVTEENALLIRKMMIEDSKNNIEK
jgi:hypothetical protein